MSLTSPRAAFADHRLISIGISALAIALSLCQIWLSVFGTVSILVQNGMQFAGFALLATLLFPCSRRAWAQQPWVRVFDVLLGLAVMAAALYLVNAESAIYARGVRLVATDWLAGGIVIIGALELTRRTMGWFIPGLILLALTYLPFWGKYIGGIFAFGGLSLETLMFRSIYGDDALFGTIARIAFNFVFMFIIFGAFLLKSGAGNFIVAISQAIAGRFVGGPGIVAVLASALTGTISGSAVANTASTGVITIPLMKRSGFSPTFAGGVEAAASTGGQIMPPIMGAGAFVMAATTQIPYTHIVVMSILPAILYFCCVGFFIRIEAKKTNLLPHHDLNAVLPSIWKIVKQGGASFVLPIVLLIVLLANGFTPAYAAGYAIICCIAASWLTTSPMNFKQILAALELGARNMVTTAILLCTVGLLINVIATAGIGNTFSLMIANWANGNLLIALVLVGLASLVLGMGLPVTAAYIVLATLSAPAIYQLIAQLHIVDILTAAELAEATKTLLAAVVPASADLFSGPLSLEQAQAVTAAIPFASMDIIINQLLTPETITFTLLAAHMIIFWLSQDSNVTPPICLAAFTAAAIAEAPAMRTGFVAWRLAKGLYLIPVLFAFTGLLSGDWPTMLQVFFFSIFGLWGTSAVISGYWERQLQVLARWGLLVVSLLLLWPQVWYIQLVALLIFFAMLLWNLRQPT